MFPCRCMGGQSSFWGTSPRSWCHVKGEQLKFFPTDSQIQSSYYFSFPFFILLTIWELDLVIVEVFSNLYDSVILWLQKGLAKTVLQIGDVLWKVTRLPCLVTAMHAPSADSVISACVWQRQLWKRLLPRLETTEHLVLRPTSFSTRICRRIEAKITCTKC